MLRRRRNFAVKWNGEDILAVPLANRLKATIHFGQTIPGTIPDFEEWEAGTAAGLNMWLWENNEYPSEFKARVVAWYRLHNSIEAHKTDASIPKPKKPK